WLVDALGGFHPVNCTGQTSDGSGYTLGQQSGPGGVFPIWDKAGNKQTQQLQTGTLNSLTSVAVADPDGASVTEAFNPAWTPDGSSRGNGYSSGTITYTDSINQLYLTASLSGEVGGGKDTYSYKDIKGNNRT